VQSDYDGNGTYEHTETWQTEIDGSQIATITDVNGSGTAIARGRETVSADGLTTILYVDPTASGQITHKDTAVTRVDGSIVETVVNVNSDGTLNQRIVSTVSANGQNVSAVTTNGPGSTVTITASNTTPNYYGIDGKATVSGTGNTISFGNAVDVAVLNGNNNTINETGDAGVTVTGTGTGKKLHAIDRDNIASISSAAIEIENDSSLTLGGSSNTITAYDNADLLVWSGTGNTLYADGDGDVATISGSTIQLWDGSSLTLTGSTDSVTTYDDTTLDIAAGTGNTLYVDGTGDVATLSGATIQVWADSTVTLTGLNDAVQLYNGSALTLLGAATGDTFDSIGASDNFFGSGASVTVEDGSTLVGTGSGNTFREHNTGSLSIWSGTGNTLEVDGTTSGDNYAKLFSSTVIVDAEAGVTVEGTGDHVVLHNGSSVWLTGVGTGDTFDSTGASDYLEVSSTSIAIEDGSTLVMVGSGNNLTEQNSGSLAITSGSGNTLEVEGTTAGDNFANLSSSTIIVDAGAGITLEGSSDSIFLNGNSWAWLDSGSSDTFDSAGTGNSLGASSSAITLESGSSLTIDGTGDTIQMGSGSSVTAGNSETFVFSSGFGHDTVSGYVASGSGADTIDVSHTMFADWSHLLAASSQSGSDVIITADSSDSITLKNTTLASLQSSQFHFT
jgi:hypothetical protein